MISITISIASFISRGYQFDITQNESCKTKNINILGSKQLSQVMRKSCASSSGVNAAKRAIV